jgi:chemotaxis protein MotA
MDLATILGFIVGSMAIIGAILLGGSLTAFLDGPAMAVTIGGTTASLLIQYPMSHVANAAKVVTKAFQDRPVDLPGLIQEIIRLANIARKEAIFALENADVEDEFLKKAAMMAADNKTPEQLQEALTTEIEAMQERHSTGKKFFESLGEAAPAWGMIGTLIGLVLMLKNLNDPSTIGPSMAVAILTTFYGAVMGNMLGNPMVTKLSIRSERETIKMQIIVVGILGIAAGENPRALGEKLEGFLSPLEKQAFKAGEGGGGGNDDAEAAAA